jgi:hypothetical protein
MAWPYGFGEEDGANAFNFVDLADSQALKGSNWTIHSLADSRRHFEQRHCDLTASSLLATVKGHDSREPIHFRIAKAL